ncbi:DUF397 domain-containing protein [Streptomyces sp. NPDC046685]|uniref:DUF397 domain-containing protein n=1 Tax=Streptomyces sp. NPDC046685 TaxID=3157202 RepID=UPI0033F8AD03
MPPWQEAPRPNSIAMKLVGEHSPPPASPSVWPSAPSPKRGLINIATLASIEQGRHVLTPDVAERLKLILGLLGVLKVAANRLPEVDRVPAWAEESRGGGRRPSPCPGTTRRSWRGCSRQSATRVRSSAAEARLQHGCDRSAGGCAHDTCADHGANSAADHQLREVAGHTHGPRSADLPGFSLKVVADLPAAVHVRDSKNPTGPVLTLAPGAWESFVADGHCALMPATPPCPPPASAPARSPRAACPAGSRTCAAASARAP